MIGKKIFGFNNSHECSVDCQNLSEAPEKKKWTRGYIFRWVVLVWTPGATAVSTSAGTDVEQDHLRCAAVSQARLFKQQLLLLHLLLLQSFHTRPNLNLGLRHSSPDAHLSVLHCLHAHTNMQPLTTNWVLSHILKDIAFIFCLFLLLWSINNIFCLTRNTAPKHGTPLVLRNPGINYQKLFMQAQGMCNFQSPSFPLHIPFGFSQQKQNKTNQNSSWHPDYRQSTLYDQKPEVCSPHTSHSSILVTTANLTAMWYQHNLSWRATFMW